jgi:cell fate regulator YaaT (PSP1 superfamily)
MLDYIENSGGRDYPFYQKGRILRVATIEDLNKQAALDTNKSPYIAFAKSQIAELNLLMKLVDVELILGGELITFYYMSEERVDFRELVHRLAAKFSTRIEMRQVGARDEARLVADYERCGQYCCCKNFLKVLKPVSMRAAKVQKATLDPLKISGRCGRLMCCLRYEDQTYKELKANLPPRNKRVGTSEGPGVVIDSKILVQLVLVRLDHDGKEIAVPVEELMDPETCPKPGAAAKEREDARLAKESEMDLRQQFRGLTAEEVEERLGPADEPGAALTTDAPAAEQRKPSRLRRGRGKRGKDRQKPPGINKQQRQDAFGKRSESLEHPQQQSGESPPESRVDAGGDAESSMDVAAQGGQSRRKKRRRRGRRRRGREGGTGDAAAGGGNDAP